ncbi:Hypothetical predicted protein [Marmota monax]|uniref:Toll-like receptor 2 n=1 Tax=Marmota monax TaxID=9995 RepID=A0A5E4CVQ0_MARMO|nr:Hypothetical predicted protein [Marmota monax]
MNSCRSLSARQLWPRCWWTGQTATCVTLPPTCATPGLRVLCCGVCCALFLLILFMGGLCPLPVGPAHGGLFHPFHGVWYGRDSHWVENLLVQELENWEPPFKLCLHKRDFVPGKWIIDNIIDCIEKSHKTVFVLSENFVRSEWCKYELDFSHFRLFDENRPFLSCWSPLRSHLS